MLHAVIMAGGAGTRFWPESRRRRPKQLLPIVGNRSMLAATVERLGDLVAPERILVATTAQLAGAIAEELPFLPREAILAEPSKRDTAPCIGLAAVRLLRDDPDAIMAVMPSDHVIEPVEGFRAAIRYAAELVEAVPNRLVTFGVRPTYAAESFGYIERGQSLKTVDPAAATFRVARFREKPDAATAREYLESGRFYWNAGIFVWKAGTILDELHRRQPDLAAGLERIAAAVDRPDFVEVLQREFNALTKISIDYAVMEHADEVLVVEAPFEWDDVGTWQSVARLMGTDQEGNTVAAKHLGIGTRGTIIRGGSDHLLVTVGLSDCIVVHTPDATLVADKNHEESVREITRRLEELGWDEYL